MDGVKSLRGKLQVLEALTQGSPLTEAQLRSVQSLLGSKAFQALRQTDQELATGALRGAQADPAAAAALKGLIEDPKFKTLGAQEKTAVLSQAKNYPSEPSVRDLGRLLQKDWFGAMSLPDKQRALKMVAAMSEFNGGTQGTVLGNTLNKLLAADSPVKKLDFDAIEGRKGHTDGANLHLSREHISDGNGPLDITNSKTIHLVTSTMAHEVSHIVNGDASILEGNAPDKYYQAFQAEYRAFWVGYKARFGEDPPREAIYRHLRDGLLSADTETPPGAWSAIRQALDEGGENSKKIVDFVGRLVGRDDLNPENITEVRREHWLEDPKSPAPVPEGNFNLDNR